MFNLYKYVLLFVIVFIYPFFIKLHILQLLHLLHCIFLSKYNVDFVDMHISSSSIINGINYYFNCIEIFIALSSFSSTLFYYNVDIYKKERHTTNTHITTQHLQKQSFHCHNVTKHKQYYCKSLQTN